MFPSIVKGILQIKLSEASYNGEIISDDPGGPCVITGIPTRGREEHQSGEGDTRMEAEMRDMQP